MKKLQLSDLSVGDWVRWNDKTYRVCVIDGVSLTVELSEELGGTIEVAIDELTGISLTPEILEKNGFVVGRKNFEYPSSREYVWGDVNLLCVQCSEFYHCRMKKADGWLLTVYAMCYVHELQHAIRLAGIDKEIEL